MTGYELRLWRKALGWTQERTAEELDIHIRTYKGYEKADRVSRITQLASQVLSLRSDLSIMQAMSREQLLIYLDNTLNRELIDES
ncbi:helix-turn-helix domain-containing protein [Xenorhabdus bovienii]|uniref:helix-turn-helix domain-containing protein n=1 Tax=Xenorhabdus bovienii TaxID=40576 RepID=UPI0023B23AB1|nr:helix-turn-helix transcriptional regulator [Xenorhabdus bovienii]MDE9487498.1 helix-turn-helix transcriptional regulator [Xenorhabdus bovienii]